MSKPTYKVKTFRTSESANIGLTLTGDFDLETLVMVFLTRRTKRKQLGAT